MAAPKHPPVVPVIQEKSTFGRWFAVIVLGTAGFFVWRFYGDKLHGPTSTGSEASIAKAEPVATQTVDSAATPVSSPLAFTKPVVTAEQPVPAAPDEPSPAATPAPAVKRGPGPFTEPLVLDVVASRRPEQVQRRERLLRMTIAEGNWNDYLDLLRRSMAIELKKSFSFDQPQAYDRYLGNPAFYTALVQHAVIATLPEDARNMIQDYENDREFFIWLLTSTAALEDWQLAVRPEDQINNALKNWAVMQHESADAREKYRALALACALVFDREFKPEWNGETLSLSAALRFNTYKLWDERGELETNLRRMGARDLTWVVNAPVPDSEMEWARKNVRLKQRDWGRAYGMVPYDMEKAVTGKQKRPYDAYTFAQILEKGGVCGDRAYFGVNTARALGIPAAEISGDGPMGGHAWMRWKADDYTWKEDGRIGGYGAGRARDPQTGKTISELEFARRSDRRANSENVNTRAYRFLWLAQLHDALGDKKNADNAIEYALAVNRNNSELWEAKLAYWSRTRRDAPVEDWRRFIDSWKHEFADDAELIATARKAEEQFIFSRQDAKLAMREMRSDVRDLENRRSGPPPTAEEIAELYQRQAQEFAKDKNIAGIRSVYHRAFREHGEDPAAFKRLARDYFGFVRGNTDAMVDAAREIESAFERHIESRDLNWFVTGSQNSALQVVADCWKEAGQPERAERMAKEMERRTKRSKREAL
jgi:hypothetical protein